MTDFSKYSDDEIDHKIKAICGMLYCVRPLYICSPYRCMEILIDNKFEFIPLEHGFEVRTMAADGTPIIAQSKNPFRAICECYLQLKEAEG